MTEQNTPENTDEITDEITDEMIQAALFDEEGNRHSDEEVAQMLYKAVHTATTIAEFTALLAELIIDAEEEEKPIHPSQIGFAIFSSPDATEPNQSGTMLGLAQALKEYITKLGISPKIASSEVARKDEAAGAFRVLH